MEWWSFDERREVMTFWRFDVMVMAMVMVMSAVQMFGQGRMLTS